MLFMITFCYIMFLHIVSISDTVGHNLAPVKGPMPIPVMANH